VSRNKSKGTLIREIHFDVPIALTTRRIGAVLITCNAADFEAIQEFLDFWFICW
jgi:hypothetical protein